MLRKKREYLLSVAEQAEKYADSSMALRKPAGKIPGEESGVKYSARENLKVQCSAKESPGMRFSAKESSFINGRKHFMSDFMERGFDPDSTDYGFLSGQFSAMAVDSFSSRLIRLIDERHMRDSQVYRAALIDRRLFSKIRSDRLYSPSKDTCIALAFALELDEEETDDLLGCAGYTLSDSSARDLAIRFLLKKKICKVTDVNFILNEMNMKTLGRQ